MTLLFILNKQVCTGTKVLTMTLVFLYNKPHYMYSKILLIRYSRTIDVQLMFNTIKYKCARYKLFCVVHEKYCSKVGGDSSKNLDTMFPYKHVWAFWSKAETM